MGPSGRPDFAAAVRARNPRHACLLLAAALGGVLGHVAAAGSLITTPAFDPLVLKMITPPTQAKVVGIAESTAIDNMERCIEQLLITLLGCETFSELFVVE
ncbi:hypothetical protein NDU88_000978 [Pleurodeles waltl]|uniref:Uncharacterized protein n=1 Tax=Pleurodeles waltl TaxID=8319 RepID=A0AAV7URK5_PLEWA|nr:hypothetical protein NDU88_000978 [Pleurodeles waltl]